MKCNKMQRNATPESLLPTETATVPLRERAEARAQGRLSIWPDGAATTSTPRATRRRRLAWLR